MARARADRLVIHAAGERWSWARLDRGGRQVAGGRAAAGESAWPDDLPALVLIDAGHCLGLTLQLPRLRGRRLRQALRWAAEPHLAGSAEDEHVVPGPRADDGGLRCVSVGNAAMHEMTDALGDTPAERMVPDALCLPWQPGRVSLAEHEGRIMARWGEWDFASFDAELAADMIDAVTTDESQLSWYGGDHPDWLADRRMTDEGGGRSLTEILAAGARTSGLNLLDGEWAPRSAATTASQWRWAAVLAAVAAVLAVTSVAIERWQLTRQSNDLEAAIEARFKAAFPEVGRIVRPRAQAERELARMRFGQAAGLLDLMHRVAPVIDGQDSMRIERLDYRDGVLELGLRAPDVAALDQLEQRLRALDLVAEVRSASLDEQGASGRIRVSERGGA